MHSTLVHINTGGLFNRTRNSPHTNTTLQERRNPRKQIKGRYLSESTMSRIESRRTKTQEICKIQDQR
jgi:hypothetical protein